jgi:integrase
MSKLKDGVIRRGSTWAYVVRVADPETGKSKPKWVGGFPTEAAAKAARDEARVAARRGEYVDRSALTVGDYLNEWVAAHAGSVKPGTAVGYRADVERYLIPRIGGLRLQGLRPAQLSKLYADLAASGGSGGAPLAASTVAHVHRTLRKALADAVRVGSCSPATPPSGRSSPAPGAASRAPSGTRRSSRRSSAAWPGIGCRRSTGSPRSPARGAVSCCSCAGRRSTWTRPR